MDFDWRRGHKEEINETEELDIIDICDSVEGSFSEFVDKASTGAITINDIEYLADVVEQLLRKVRDEYEEGRGSEDVTDGDSIH